MYDKKTLLKKASIFITQKYHCINSQKIEHFVDTLTIVFSRTL